MNKIISFTLYGNEPKYVKGIYENLNIQKKEGIYYDWDILIYHDDTVKESVLDYLKSEGVILEDMTNSGILAGCWRLCAGDRDCERFIVRDADSRISIREEEAVEEWIRDDTRLHIMRDHPHHGYPILGGMWGMKTDVNFCMKTAILKYQGGKARKTNERNAWIMKDMDFLRDVIYSEFGKPDQSTIHNAMDFMHRVNWDCEYWAKDFPSPIGRDKMFVGEVYDFDEIGLMIREYQCRER